VNIERANRPRWVPVDERHVSSKLLHSDFRRIATCNKPSDRLINELRVVAEQSRVAKLNELRVRHGRQPEPLAVTVFDDWIVPPDRVRANSLEVLVEMCEMCAVWSFSAFGLYADCFSRSSQVALARIRRACVATASEFRRVSNRRELPEW
jgi:hypothetical protein